MALIHCIWFKFLEDDFAKLQVFDSLISLHGSSDGKESAYNSGDPGSIPGSERSPGEEIGYPL